nr:NTP transferase domain-containing protein [Candidatus Aenigmarchaeota archaeon]
MRKKKVKTFGVVLAGGYGARLWPVSRTKRPKHLLNLTSQKSLVQETVDRLSEVVDEVFIISEASHANELKRQLSNLPEENIIFEPGRRGTASCIGLAAVYLKKMREEGVAISVPADHFIPEKESFISVLKSA